MTIRLTMLEERKLVLAVAAMTFSSMLAGKKENKLIVMGFRLMGENLWSEVFGDSYAAMLERNYPDEEEMRDAMKQMVVNFYPGARP